MIRITFINGSYYCEPGITLLELKRDSFDRKGKRRRLRASEIVTFLDIDENVHGKWTKVRTKEYLTYYVKPEDLIFQKEMNRRL